MAELYTYLVHLDALNDTTATFVGGLDDLVTLAIPREHWIELGRPGVRQFTPEAPDFPPVERPPAFAPLHQKDPR